MRALGSTRAGAAGTVLALALVLCAPNPAAAEPTDEQVAAIKSNCRSDYMSYCWSVPRGGPEAAQCLKKNLAKLSPGCQQAVKAATAAAAPPSAPAAEAKPATTPPEPAPSAAPAATAKATAPAPEPAGQTQDAAPKAASPAGSDQTAPSSGATAAKEAAPAPAPAAASKTAAPTPAAEAAPAGAAVKAPSATQNPAPDEPEATTAAVPHSSSEPPGFIPPRKKLMLVRNCRHDFKVFCPDVDLGGGRAIVCLEDNKAQLTPDCRDALAKVTR